MTSVKEYEQGREVFKALKLTLKNIEERRDKILNPLKQSVKATKELFQPFIEKVEREIDIVGSNLKLWANEQEQKRIQEQTRLDNDRRLKNPETIQKRQDQIAERPEGTRNIRKLVITDPAKVPDRFWIIDEVALRQALMADEKVPGAELKEELIITSK